MKARTLLALLVLAAGCGGHFDKYEAGVRALEAGDRGGVMFPQTHFVGQVLPGFTIVRDGKLTSTFDMTDDVVVVAVADRSNTSEMVPWIDDITSRYGEKLELIPVINLHNEHPLKKTLFRAFITGSAYWQYFGPFRARRTYLPQPVLDYSGRIESALALSGHGPFIVVAKKGEIVGFFAGRAIEERLLSLRTILDESLPVAADRPLAAVSAPVVLGEKPLLSYPHRAASSAKPRQAERKENAEERDDLALLPAFDTPLEITPSEPVKVPPTASSGGGAAPVVKGGGRAPVVTAFIPDAVATIEEPAYRPPEPATGDVLAPPAEGAAGTPAKTTVSGEVDKDIEDILREL